MPCRRDFADVALAAEDRAAVLEAAQVLSDHLPVEAGALEG
jgi:endonuclease/exonuclease/phosphatase family metal-dependent hydrolase